MPMTEQPTCYLKKGSPGIKTPSMHAASRSAISRKDMKFMEKTINL